MPRIPQPKARSQMFQMQVLDIKESPFSTDVCGVNAHLGFEMHGWHESAREVVKERAWCSRVNWKDVSIFFPSGHLIESLRGVKRRGLKLEVEVRVFSLQYFVHMKLPVRRQGTLRSRPFHLQSVLVGAVRAMRNQFGGCKGTSVRELRSA
jgi:hypothetical protein